MRDCPYALREGDIVIMGWREVTTGERKVEAARWRSTFDSARVSGSGCMSVPQLFKLVNGRCNGAVL
jgi:hypothetical protein